MKNLYKKNAAGKCRKMYRNFLIVAAASLLMGISGIKAQVWNVPYCSGLPSVTQSNAYGPMYSVATANATNRSAFIYPSSQLGAISGKVLTSIYFHTGAGNTAGMLGTPNFKIYLKEIASADWGSTALDWTTASTGAALVFDGNPAPIIGTTGGWKQFPLSTSFTYSGHTESCGSC